MTLTGRKRKLVASEEKGSTRNTVDKAYISSLIYGWQGNDIKGRFVGEIA